MYTQRTHRFEPLRWKPQLGSTFAEDRLRYCFSTASGPVDGMPPEIEQKPSSLALALPRVACCIDLHCIAPYHCITISVSFLSSCSKKGQDPNAGGSWQDWPWHLTGILLGWIQGFCVSTCWQLCSNLLWTFPPRSLSSLSSESTLRTIYKLCFWMCWSCQVFLGRLVCYWRAAWPRTNIPEHFQGHWKLRRLGGVHKNCLYPWDHTHTHISTDRWIVL